ncbi:MAG: hypothetical protein ACFCVA_08650 [Gammaproteobacteria bacterium]
MDRTTGKLLNLRELVRDFSEARPAYRRLASILSDILGETREVVGAPVIVQARAKDVGSFAEKIRRPGKAYCRPLEEITDLCGARVIVHTLSQATRICRFVESRFIVLEMEDKTQELGAERFGYRSRHYVVQLNPDSTTTEHASDELFTLKAEIQVRTLLQHAWADFAHDLSYKGRFQLPANWQRELQRLAAMLEEADIVCDRLSREIEEFSSHYDAFVTPAELYETMERYEAALESDGEHPHLAHQLGRMAMALGEWDRAIAAFEPYQTASYVPLLRDLGVSLCKRHAKDPDGDDFLLGQKLLQQATELDPEDVDAWASLAGSWRTREIAASDETKRRTYHGEAHRHYRKAYEVGPHEAYALGNYIEYEAKGCPHVDIVSHFRPMLLAAVARCERHAEVGINLPWACFDLGKFRLMLGQPFQAVAAYAKAAQCCTSAVQISSALRSFEDPQAAAGNAPGFDWAKHLLILAQRVRFEETPAGKRSVLGAEPVVIVAGYCSRDITENHRRLLADAFAGFEGTIISGGTTAGVSGFVGELQCGNNRVTTVGYLPRTIPESASEDRRYGRLRHTDGAGFSPLDAMAYWEDLHDAGVPPSRVTVLAIDGGELSEAECCIALALGARVGILQDAGGPPAKLLESAMWNRAEPSKALNGTARPESLTETSLRAFLTQDKSAPQR